MQERSTLAFIRAIGLGTLVGGGPWLLLTLPIGFVFAVSGEIGGLMLAIFPVLIAGGVTFASMTVIGLPLTAFLEQRGAESERIYAAAGAGAGAIIPMIVLTLLYGSDLWFEGVAYALAFGGMLAGLTTALSWANHRDRLRAEREEAEAEPEPNPIHDLIY